MEYLKFKRVNLCSKKYPLWVWESEREATNGYSAKYRICQGNDGKYTLRIHQDRSSPYAAIEAASDAKKDLIIFASLLEQREANKDI